MQGGKNWILPKEKNANLFFSDSHWLEIWSNHFCPSMGLNGGSVAMDSVVYSVQCTFSNRSAPDRGKWCGPTGQAAWTIRHLLNTTLLVNSPPGSQAGRRVGPAL
jgi:hypothetical protein